jgi:hypothetical protein
MSIQRARYIFFNSLAHPLAVHVNIFLNPHIFIVKVIVDDVNLGGRCFVSFRVFAAFFAAILIMVFSLLFRLVVAVVSVTHSET